MKNPMCEGSYRGDCAPGQVRLLPVTMREPHHGNMILCQNCFAHEIRERNRSGEEAPAWESLKVYSTGEDPTALTWAKVEVISREDGHKAAATLARCVCGNEAWHVFLIHDSHLHFQCTDCAQTFCQGKEQCEGADAL